MGEDKTPRHYVRFTLLVDALCTDCHGCGIRRGERSNAHIDEVPTLCPCVKSRQHR